MNRKIVLAIGILGALLVVIALRQNRRAISVSGEHAKVTEKHVPAERLKVEDTTPPSAAESVEPVANEETDGIPPERLARMKRMGQNLLKPQLSLDEKQAEELRAQWSARFLNETDPLLKKEVITEMVQLDDAPTIKLMTDFLNSETSAEVREQIVLILGFMKSSRADMPLVSSSVMAAYEQSEDARERETILKVMPNLETPESVQFLKKAFDSAPLSTDDRYNAVNGLFQLARSEKITVDPKVIDQVTVSLKQEAQTAPDDQWRLRAVQSLAQVGQNNKPFLRGLLATETNAQILEFLRFASYEPNVAQ
ncbi:MAG: hypothetical protein ABJC04_08440 [Verrucomicrobiota bacterium]